MLKLNSKGVTLLQSKRYAKSATVFSSCLADLKAQLADTDADSNIQDDPASICGDPYSFRFPEASHDNMLSSLRHHGLFGSPIKVVADDTRSKKRSRSSVSLSSASAKSLSKMCFAVLYNLGLSFHLQALQMEESSRCCTEQEDDKTTLRRNRRLQKAVAFYEAANRILDTQKKSSSSSKNNAMDKAMSSLDGMERLALWNNTGHVHRLLGSGNTQQAKQCHDDMLSSVVWITHCGDRRRVFQFDLFFSNAIVHVLKPSQSASAA